MDYHDLFGLDVIDQCREGVERSDEVFRTWNVYSSVESISMAMGGQYLCVIMLTTST